MDVGDYMQNMIYLPISDNEIGLVSYELLKRNVPDDYRLQLEQELKQMQESHLIPETIIKQFLQEIVEVYRSSNISRLPNPMESITKFATDITKPYNELLNKVLRQFDYNKEQIIEIDEISSSYSPMFERNRRRSRTGVVDNTAEVQEKVQGYFKYAIELAKLDKLQDDIRSYDSMLTITKDIISEIETRHLPLEEIKNACINFNNHFTTQFATIRPSISSYNEYMQAYYRSHISDASKLESGQDFKFIVHNVTNGFPETLDFKTRYVSASLITDKTLGLFSGFSEAEFNTNRKGFILSPSNIVSAQHKDTWTSNRESGSDNLFYREGYAILSPETIEKRCLDIAKENKFDQLSENAPIYSEIVIDGFLPQAVFCITNGEGTLNPDYRDSLKQAKKFGLPLIEINQREYRKKANLSPLTPVGERILTKEVIERIMPEYMKSVNDFNNLRNILMTEDVCKKIADIFNQMTDKQVYNENDFVKLASETIVSKINNSNLLLVGEKQSMIQSINDNLQELERQNQEKDFSEAKEQLKTDLADLKNDYEQFMADGYIDEEEVKKINDKVEQLASSAVALKQKGLNNREIKIAEEIGADIEVAKQTAGIQSEVVNNSQLKAKQEQPEIKSSREQEIDQLKSMKSKLANNNTNNFAQNVSDSVGISQQVSNPLEKGKQKTIGTYPKNNSTVQNSGFVNGMILTLLIGFVLGSIFTVVYLVLNIGKYTFIM